jgi:hypothetical protein
MFFFNGLSRIETGGSSFIASIRFSGQNESALIRLIKSSGNGIKRRTFNNKRKNNQKKTPT